MKDQTSTKTKLNRLMAFRQAIYRHGYQRQKDGQFELTDALLTLGSQPSPAYLSQAPCFRRTWSSVYTAIEDGEQATEWLQGYLLEQVEESESGVQYFALDTSSWVRKQAVTLPERQYVHQATNAVKGGEVSVGYAYSFLNWVSVPHSSWALPVHTRRVKITETCISAALEQVRWLSQQRQSCAGIDIVTADGTYGTSHFLGPLRGQGRVGIVTRLAKHRVLYRCPPPRCPGQRGRHRRHGAAFAFKKPETWLEADEQVRFDDPIWGTVELRRWNCLHDLHDWQTHFDVMYACVHVERASPPEPIWLAWLPPQSLPPQTNARFVWNAFQQRWPIEPHFRFRKQHLMWTRPRWLCPAACDRWTRLVDLAFWQLYLARDIVADQPLPWQPHQSLLTPLRVLQAFPRYFSACGTPAQPPQTRGYSSGWPIGKSRQHRLRSPVTKKGS